MEYNFIAYANPAYRFFTTKFLTEGGVDYVDEYMNHERAQAILRELPPKRPKTRAEDMFCETFGRQHSDPQGLLESRSMLEKIFGKLDESRIAELSLLLPPNTGLKFVFTKEDVARSINHFYAIDFKVAITTDLEDGNPRSLYKYILDEDERHLPKPPVSEFGEYDVAVRAWTEKLLLWINQASPERISEEIAQAIAEHEATPFSSHMTRIRYGREHHYDSCKHGSKYVELQGTPREDGALDLSLLAYRRPEYSEMDPGPYIISPSFSVEPRHD
jgi:hypothetical protein